MLAAIAVVRRIVPQSVDGWVYGILLFARKMQREA
jgi:hypothetical protein